MNVLVMVSGGLDSTAALTWLLRETTHGVFVHHLELRNREQRDFAERTAVLEIVAHLHERVRPFQFSSSAIDTTRIGVFPDAISTYFMAGQLLPRLGCDKVVTGRCKEDDNGDQSWPAARRVLQALTQRDPADLVFTSPFANKTKREAADYLGPELFALVWSCRQPKFRGLDLVQCGECRACLHYAQNNLTHRRIEL